MFQVRREGKRTLLDKEKATAFHHTVVQMIFATSRSGKDTKTSIPFLRTQVRSPYEDEWLKLVRVIRYIRGTMHLTILLRANSLSVIKWWVDASFAAHPD